MIKLLFSDIQKGFGKWIVSNFERSYLLILIGSDSNELCLMKTGFGYFFSQICIESINNNARLIFVQRIQLDLSLIRRLVGEFNLVKRERVLHPVGAKIGTVRMLVLAFKLNRIRLGALLPLSVYVFPFVVVYLLKVNNHLIDCGRIESTDGRFDHRKHVAARSGYNHFVCFAKEPHPQVAVLQPDAYLIIALGWVAALLVNELVFVNHFVAL